MTSSPISTKRFARSSNNSATLTWCSGGSSNVSITRLARAYNLVIPPSGRTLSGGLDPASLHKPKEVISAR
jgi:hypothetical protein